MNPRVIWIAFLVATQSFAAASRQSAMDIHGNAQRDLNGISASTIPDTEVAVEKGGPYDRVYHPENLPALEDSKFFPATWQQLAANPQHNAAFEVSTGAPEWLSHGVEWKFAEARS